MIELPEALAIARQMSRELKGKRIREGIRGNSPHKFAFYSRPPDEYQTILAGKTMGEATDHGGEILAAVEPDHVLVLGCGGERILLHKDESSLPKKHQLLLSFSDGTFLSVTVQGWGAALLLHKSELHDHPLVGRRQVSPLDEGFTFERFQRLFGELEEGDSRSVKFFAVSKPGIWGLGNGYLQDILFRAKIHPRRRAVSLDDQEKRAFYEAVKGTIREAAELGGRDTERDLYNRPGRYVRTLDSRTLGRPCPQCGTAIEKIFYLGGASYFCPSCQV